jgi:transposase
MKEVDPVAPLSHTVTMIQKALFAVEEEWGQLTECEELVLKVVELTDVERLVGPPRRGWRGRPEADRRPMARALIAMKVLRIPTRRALLERLESSPRLRRVCGWERRDEIPTEATMSRAFRQFADGELPARVHRALIEKAYEKKIVGHVSRDSTAIHARERAVKRPKGEKKRKEKPTRLERQAAGMGLQEMVDDLPKVCDHGCKRNSRGKLENWRGYKLHVDWADGEIPLSCILTSASVHDSQVAIPLAVTTANRVVSLYDLMDSAYDSEVIRQHSQTLGHVPIIDRNKRNRREGPDPFDPAKVVRYNERTTAERGMARLKDDFGARMVRVRGAVKVMADLMFAVLALTADRLLQLLC